MAALSSPPGAREPERWSVHSGRERVREWEDVLAATHVGFDVRCAHQDFRGAVVRRRFGELLLVDCVCTPFAGHRGTAVMGDAGEALIGFQTVRKGAERVRVRSGEQVVTPGQAVLWDGAHQVDVEVVEPFMKRTLILPRDRALAVCPRLSDMGALTPLRESSGGRLLVRYLDALASEMPTTEDSTAATAGDVALELLRAAIEPDIPGGRDAQREVLRGEVRRHIRRHLRDPRLSPESIAKAQAISLRALHALFEDTGESVAALVRQSRLARCWEDLRRPTAGSVTEIAFRWGFSDAAHFSHVFKREYGVAPREVRRAALAEQVPSARTGKESSARFMVEGPARR